MGIGVEAEEGGGDLAGASSGVALVARHLSFARTGQAVRIDGDQMTLKVASGAAQAPQGELKLFRMLKGMGHEQVMDALIGNHEREAIEKFKALLAERSSRTNMYNSQSGFVHELHGHAGGKVRRRRPGPVGQ